jgi:diacylglycerol O-acyltransferase
MLASYPVLPLLPGHAVAIAATSYDGRVYYGIDADRDAVPDVGVLAQCIRESIDELVDASSASRATAPRGRLPRRGDG